MTVSKITYLPTAWVDEVCPSPKMHPNDFLAPTCDQWALYPSEFPVLFKECEIFLNPGDVVELTQIKDLGSVTLEYRDDVGLIEIDEVPADAVLFVDGFTDDGAVTFEQLREMVKDELAGELIEGELLEAHGYHWQDGHRAKLTVDATAKCGARLDLLPFNPSWAETMRKGIQELDE